MSAPILSTPPFAASPLKWRSARLALLLLPARRAHAAAYTPAVAITNWSPLIAVGEETSTYVWDAADFWLDANSVTHTWTGSGQVLTDVAYPAPYVTGANFLAVTPGVFDYTVVADWSAHPFNYGLPSADCRTTNVLPATFTVVNVTNVTATAYHVAEGHAPITLTAHMTPVNAPAKVTWSIVQGEGGGNLSATSGLTTQYDGGLGWRACKVRATCGTNRTDTIINIYRVTGITASVNPVAAGDPVTFTAITDPPNCPLPIIWNISTNTDLSVTNAFASPGLINVTATLGSSIAECTLTNVGVKEVQYEWPRDSGIWTPCPFPWYLPKDADFRVRAKRNPPDIDPENETWPKPVVWSDQAMGSGTIGNALFPTTSTNHADYRFITATCGTTNSNPAVIYTVDSIEVSTNHVAIGTNSLLLTAKLTPPGIYYPVVWTCTNAVLPPVQGVTTLFPCDQAGVFTVTATLGSTCGFSSASTNINVYRVTEVTASPSLVAAGEPVVLTATTEPGNCPLPLIWAYNGAVGFAAGTTGTTNFAAGHHTVAVTLGSSEANCALTSVSVAEIKYEAVPNSDNWLTWPASAYFPKGSAFRVKAIPNPANAEFPANQPVWGGAATSSGPIRTATFSVNSTNTNDFRLITATCSNTKTNLATVYEWVPNIEPMVNFTNRATNRFGVAEDLYLNIKVTPTDLQPSAVGDFWWADGGEGGILNGDGSPSGNTTFGSPETATWVFPSAHHHPAVFASNPGAVATLTEARQIVAPDEVRFFPRPSATEDNLFHLALRWNIRVILKFHIKPRDVAWDNVRFKEKGGELSVATNWLAPYNARPHPASTNWGLVVRDTNAPPRHVGAGEDKVETPVLSQGHPYPVFSDGYQPAGNVPPYAAGNFRWDIEWLYCVHRGGVKSVNEYPFAVVPQIFTSDQDGRATVRKGNFGPVGRGLLDTHDYLEPEEYDP